MTELETAIVATLRAEAEEAAMTTDTSRESDKLDARLDEADRHRRSRTWLAVGAAAAAIAAVAVAVAVLLNGGATGARPPVVSTPSASLPAMHVFTSTLSPNLEVDLPGWTAYAHRNGWSKDSISYPQSADSGVLHPDGEDRNFIMLTPSYFYAPDDHTNIVTKPTYAAYVAAWDGLEAARMGTVRDRKETTVDGRSAVVMTVDFTSTAAGLAACETDTQAPDDCWNTGAGRTARLAIIDGGSAGPLLIYDAMNTSNPDKAGLAAELDAALSTVALD